MKGSLPAGSMAHVSCIFTSFVPSRRQNFLSVMTPLSSLRAKLLLLDPCHVNHEMSLVIRIAGKDLIFSIVRMQYCSPMVSRLFQMNFYSKFIL